MTPNLWTLPETVHFADMDWRVHTDFRDVLEILRWLDGSAEPALTDSERWYVALALFYRIFRSYRQCNTEKPVKQWQHLCRRGAPTADPVRPG